MYIYTTENDTLNLKNEIETRGEVNAVDYDATGKFLAVSGYARAVNVYDTTSYEVREYIIYNNNCTYMYIRYSSKKICQGGVVQVTHSAFCGVLLCNTVYGYLP